MKKPMKQIVSVVPSGVKRKLPFPRVMWADYDAEDLQTPVVVYPIKSEQRGNRPDLKPIRVLVVALENDHQSAIAEAIDVLNRHAEQGHILSARVTKAGRSRS